MDKDNDYPSDSDQSDEDFRPENESDSDIPSNEESDYKGSDSDVEENETKRNSTKNAKRKKLQTKNRRNKIKNSDNQLTNDDKISINESNNCISEEEEKKKSDDLWASFLSDVNGTTDNKVEPETVVSKTNKSNNTNSSNTQKKELAAEENIKNNVEKDTDKVEEKVTITEILEFAGEKVEVTKEVTKASAKTIQSGKLNEQNNIVNKFSKVPLKRPGGGLSSILGQIGKKNKLSVLEKTKLDWEGFKKNEGLKEEIETFNRGKNGYLEKQDFLQRTDVRQFEIEKDLRKTKRKF